MGLTITTAPPAHNFIKNPIVFELTTNKYIITAGVKHKSKIAFTAAPTVGPSSFSITVLGVTVSMTGVTTVDDSGNQFRFKTGFETFDDWLVSFSNAVKSNYLISSNFVVTYDTALDELYLEARETGLSYNITFISTPGTSVGSSVTAGVTREVNNNFHVILELNIKDIAGLDLATHKLDMERISDTLFRIRVEEVVRKFVNRQLPALNTTGIFASTKNTAYFNIRYFELYGDVVDEKYYYTGADTYYLLNGAINEIEYPSSNFLSTYNSQYKFLTWQKRSKYVTKSQPETLAWFKLSNDANPDIELKVVLYYTSGSTYTYYTINLTGASGCKVYYADTSYMIVADPVAGDVVDYYTVQVCVKTTHAALSEIMTYHVLQSDTANTRYFRFANSLGWWDVIRTTGDRVGGVSVSVDVYEKFLLHNYTIDSGRFCVSEKEGKRTFKQNTGFLESKNVLDYLAEFMLNPLAYEIRNGKYIPIIITTADIRLSSDFSQKDKYYIEFEYYEAYNYLGLNSTTL